MDYLSKQLPFLFGGWVSIAIIVVLLALWVGYVTRHVIRPFIAHVAYDGPGDPPPVTNLGLIGWTVLLLFTVAILSLAAARTMYVPKNVIEAPANPALDEELGRTRQEIEPAERRDPEADKREAEEQNRRAREEAGK
jgi:hypothetical protein